MLSGALFGLFLAGGAILDGAPTVVAATGGVVVGVVFGLIMCRFLRRMTGDLSHLERADRVEVLRATREGRAPRSPALATDVVRYARKAPELNQNPRSFLILVGFAGLSILVAIGRAVAGELSVVDVVQVAVWMALLPLVRLMSRRAADRAGKAEHAAVLLLQPSDETEKPPWGWR